MNPVNTPKLSPDFYRSLWDDSPQSTLVFTKDAVCQYVSPGARRILARSVEDYVGMNWENLIQEIHSEDRVYVRAAWEKLLKGGFGTKLSVLFRLRSKNNDYRLVESTASNRVDDPALCGVVFHLNTVVDRRTAEEMLISERERLLVTLRSIGDGVVATDIEGKITLINKVTEELTGWTQWEAMGKPLPEVFHIVNEETLEKCENPVEKVFRQGTVIGLANHTALISRSGRMYSIEDSAAPIRNKNGEIIGAVLVFRDVTEQKRTNEELLKIQKLESIGVLAGGIAHDFNNILTAIMGNASLAMVQTSPFSPAYELLEGLSQAANRARDLTQQLLTFAKGGSPVLRPVSLPEIIEEGTRFILHGTKVSCQFDFRENLMTAQVDAGQMAQVVQNLVLNAVQAMPEGGNITIAGRNIRIPEDDLMPLPAGPYLKLEFSDTGIGIPKDLLQKIFEPYFTTKDKGSGLGLSIAHSIVKNHNGLLRAESVLGKGTVFHLYIPALEQSQVHPALQSLGHGTTLAGRVLVMDDEDQPRRTIAQMLKFLGFETVEATHGQAAVELLQTDLSRGLRFELAILDLTVPGGMGGREAVTALKTLDPELKAVVSSGYSSDPILSRFQDYAFDGCLSKPFTVSDLARVVRLVLGVQNET